MRRIDRESAGALRRCDFAPPRPTLSGTCCDSLSVRPDSRRRRIGVLRTGRIWRDSNSVSFVFKGLQGGKVSLPPSRRRAPDVWIVALAKAEHSGDRARPCDVPPRARCSVARPRRPATAALVRSTTRLAGVCSHAAWVSGRAWPRRILVIGGRGRRVARLHIFRNIISQISKSGPQMRFRIRQLEHFPIRQDERVIAASYQVSAYPWG